MNIFVVEALLMQIPVICQHALLYRILFSRRIDAVKIKLVIFLFDRIHEDLDKSLGSNIGRNVLNRVEAFLQCLELLLINELTGVLPGFAVFAHDMTGDIQCDRLHNPGHNGR